MAQYRDPRGPKGTVLLRGYAFTDGVSKDIHPTADTLRLFKAWGITEVKPKAAPVEKADKPEEKKEK